MARKIRELVADLVRAGFVDRGRNFLHPKGIRITLSGRAGNDARRYQEEEVARRIAAARSTEGGGR